MILFNHKYESLKRIKVIQAIESGVSEMLQSGGEQMSITEEKGACCFPASVSQHKPVGRLLSNSGYQPRGAARDSQVKKQCWSLHELPENVGNPFNNGSKGGEDIKRFLSSGIGPQG